MTPLQELTQWYMPSRPVEALLAERSYYPHVRVQPLLRTKRVELRLQKTKSATGPRYVMQWDGIPIDFYPGAEAIDEEWKRMCARALVMIDHMPEAEAYAPFGIAPRIF